VYVRDEVASSSAMYDILGGEGEPHLKFYLGVFF